MNRKKNMSRLLALVMVLSGGIGTKAFYYPDPETHSEEQFAEFIKSHPQYSMTSWFWDNDKGAKTRTQKQAIEFAKRYGLNEFEVLDIWQYYHENEDIDKNYLLQKLIDINNEMTRIIDYFINCYDSLDKIKLRIDNWFKEIENSEGFDKVLDKILKKKLLKGIGLCEYSRDTYPLDLVKTFYETLPAEEKNTFDNNSENFRKELLKTELFKREYQEMELSKANHRIKNCNLDVDGVCSLLKNDKTKKILEIQKSLILELYKNYDKIKEYIYKWEKFINTEKFYEYKVHYDYFLYDYDIKIKLKMEYFKHEKIVLENLNEDLEKILKDNTNKE